MLKRLIDDLGVLSAACVLGACASGNPEVVRPVRPAEPTWVKNAGGEGSARVEKVVVDSNDDVVAIGSFTGTIEIDGISLQSAGDSDIFLLKLDRDGQVHWTRRFGSSGEDRGRSVAVDADGNIAITGLFSGEIDFGAGVLAGTAENSAFVAKFTGAGEPLWSRAFGDQQYHTGTDLAIGEGGDLYVTGDFVLTADFGGGVHTSAGSADIFVAKFDSDGGHRLSRALGDAEAQQARAIAVTSAGEILLLGVFYGVVDFGGITLKGGAGMQRAMFVAKFDADMKPIWVLPALSWTDHARATHGDDGAETKHEHDYALGHSVATALNGSTVVAGAASNGSTVNGPEVEVHNPPQALLQRFGQNGGRTLSRPLGLGPTQDEGALAVDGSGNVVVTAAFLGTLDFGNGMVLTSAGGRDLLLSEFDASGTYVDSLRYGEADRSEIGWSVALDSEDDVIIGGWSRPLNTFGVDRALLVKFER